MCLFSEPRDLSHFVRSAVVLETSFPFSSRCAPTAWILCNFRPQRTSLIKRQAAPRMLSPCPWTCPQCGELKPQPCPRQSPQRRIKNKKARVILQKLSAPCAFSPHLPEAQAGRPHPALCSLVANLLELSFAPLTCSVCASSPPPFCS